MPDDSGPKLHPDLEHFINLAVQGKRPGSSGGEKRCRRMALCILDNASGVDSSALDGLKRFIDTASLVPEMARRVIR